MVAAEVALGDLARVIELEEFVLCCKQLLEFSFGSVDERLLLAKHVARGRVVRIHFLG